MKAGSPYARPEGIDIAARLAAARVLPVLTPRDEASTVRTCEALAAGGMSVVEITLRTPAALASLSAVRDALPEVTVAAGTVTTPAALAAATEAGAAFCVSPGLTTELLAAARGGQASLLPGVATASEVMTALAHGIDVMKLFPAEAAGGIALLKSLAGPFATARFCPTGGLTAANFRDYLALGNVIACGGSWMVAGELVDNERWDEIERLAREAVSTD